MHGGDWGRSMVIGILQNTPLWVWGVLLGLLALGLSQTRTRKVTRLLVLLLPALMITLSFYSVIASFGIGLAAIGAWAIGLAGAVALNGFGLFGPNGIRYSLEDQRFELPGSWLPLVLMLTIFCTRFVLGVATALNPSMVGTTGFIVCMSAILGLCSGIFLSRGIRTLAVRP